MELFKDLLYNTTLLISMSIAGNIFYIKPRKNPIFASILHGLIVGGIGIVLMLSSVELSPGLIFDTRSILISVTAIFYGGIPTGIAVLLISAYRIMMGGTGAVMGVLVTVLTAATGLLWKHFRFQKIIKRQKSKWVEFYIFGLITHLVMISCALSLPRNMAIETIKTIAGPVLLVYPLGVLALCLITFYIQNAVQTKTMLAEIEIRFSAVFNQAPIGIAIANRDKTFFINPKLEEITGRPKDEISSVGWQRYTHPDDLHEDEDQFSRLIAGEITSYSMRKRYIKPNGSIVWVHLIIAALHTNSPNDDGSHICMVQDITDLIDSENELRNSENKYKNLYLEYSDKESLMVSLLDSIPDLIFYKDQNSIYMGCNKAFEDFAGKIREEIIGHSDFDLFDEKSASLFRAMDIEMMKKKAPNINEETTRSSDGHKKVLETLKTPYYNYEGKLLGLIGISRDITERKQKEEEILHLTNHDVLTGLYNRLYFEKALKRIDDSGNLPYSVMVGDINSLKLVNDIFGHDQGNILLREAAALLQTCCRPNDIIARTGGDEFSVILSETDEAAAKSLFEKITEAFYKRSLISGSSHLNSISIGYVTKNKNEEEIGKLIKIAEEHMSRRKLLNNKSIHSSLLTTIKTAVFEKSNETEAHAERMVNWAKNIGINIGLSQDELVDLELATTLHDLGKIGIDGNIIAKPGKLNEIEWIEIRKHPEIGFRIARTIPELQGIAEYILCHHERWDGKGYPQGLTGEKIPLISRIISVVDSFDAMTEDRPYRAAMSKEAALAEIKNCSGAQFDPKVAQVFMNNTIGA